MKICNKIAVCGSNGNMEMKHEFKKKKKKEQCKFSGC